MKALKLVGLVLLVFVIFGIVLGWFEIRRGFSARGEPSSIEIFLATTARKLALPSSYRRLRNPLPASAESIQAGMEHFADHCATCHANDGSGDSLFGKGLYPKPPDMRKAETQDKSDGELYYVIENGVRLSGMPAFGEHSGIDDADTWKLVVFIRHLPQLSAEELQKMEQLNPKTEEERQEEKEEEEFLHGDISQPQGSSSHHH
jgi:mono/diheme cytochrome c family protein